MPTKTVQGVLNEFVVTTKMASQFFSEKAYINNANTLDVTFEKEEFTLSRSQGSRMIYNVQRITNDFSNEILYNDQFRFETGWGSMRIQTYDTVPGFVKLLPYKDMKRDKYKNSGISANLNGPLTI